MISLVILKMSSSNWNVIQITDGQREIIEEMSDILINIVAPASVQDPIGYSNGEVQITCKLC